MSPSYYVLRVILRDVKDSYSDFELRSASSVFEEGSCWQMAQIFT